MFTAGRDGPWKYTKNLHVNCALNDFPRIPEVAAQYARNLLGISWNRKYDDAK